MTTLYEWHWTSPNGHVFRTRRPRSAAALKRAAARSGGEVLRYKVGYHERADDTLDRLNELARTELETP